MSDHKTTILEQVFAKDKATSQGHLQNFDHMTDSEFLDYVETLPFLTNLEKSFLKRINKSRGRAK